MARQSLEELETAAYDAIPATGSITYEAVSDALVASGNGEAIRYLRHLKHAGRISMRVEVSPDGTIAHLVSRVGSSS